MAIKKPILPFPIPISKLDVILLNQVVEYLRKCPGAILVNEWGNMGKGVTDILLAICCIVYSVLRTTLCRIQLHVDNHQ